MAQWEAPEPWMVEFVKGRHTQEEWDAFYAYLEASPRKRWWMRFSGMVLEILGWIHG